MEQRIQDLERKMERIANKSIADIEAGFKRGVSLDERFLRLKTGQVEELTQYHHLRLLDCYLKVECLNILTGTDTEDDPIFLFHIGWSRERE